MSRSNVVLPLPEAPSTAVIDRSGTLRSTPASTRVAPKALLASRSSIALMPRSVHYRERSNHNPSNVPGTTASATMTSA